MLWLLAGFSSFDTDDQVTIVRLGQSSSRVLVAALHWYDSDRRNFRNFLSWRAGGERDVAATGLDLFKQQLISFSETMIGLELDPVEAAMLNVLLVTASGKLFFVEGRFHSSLCYTSIRHRTMMETC